MSDTPSGLVELAAGYFLLSGVLRALILTGVVLAAAFGWGASSQLPLNPLSIAATAVAAAGEMWTARLLSRRRLSGGILALGFVLIPVVAAILGSERSLIWYTVVWAMLSAAVLAGVWRELE